MFKSDNGPGKALMRERRARHPSLRHAVVADARLALVHQLGPRPGAAPAPCSRFCWLCWSSDAFLAQAIYRAKAALQRRGVPVLPQICHRLSIAIAGINIDDPVIMHPGVHILHGQGRDRRRHGDSHGRHDRAVRLDRPDLREHPRPDDRGGRDGGHQRQRARQAHGRKRGHDRCQRSGVPRCSGGRRESSVSGVRPLASEKMINLARVLFRSRTIRDAPSQAASSSSPKAEAPRSCSRRSSHSPEGTRSARTPIPR